ncbi:AI-2E family transporter [Halorussus sp. MSC15.2]|uniref:AI-2E family transporter n=1 Tax=Halorussus sp. MSC15.2 TaxID=2283638 RepID=UPI0013D67316|nr:AI-2E family transporter [Halorussus sp. MSC15.2]NEU58392.1 AI-2E family transporter [Halorussus sp. MSC15.2]
MAILPEDRERLAWWVFTAAMLGLLAFVLWSFVGTVVFGVFLYYGMRPLDRRLRRRLSSDTAADLTMVLVTVPVVLLVGYTAVVGIQELSQLTGSDPSSFARFVPWSPQNPTALVEDLQKVLGPEPARTNSQELLSAVVSGLSTAATALAHFFLSLLLAFVLLREDGRLAAWYRDQFGSEGSAAYTYALAVDRDLHSVYVGNVLTVFAVTVLGLVVYNGLNLVAPPDLAVPAPALVALLTGLATLVPLVVGKIVYVPVGLLLTYQATRGPGSGALWFPMLFFAVCFLVLDLLPVAILRPIIAGRNVHGGLMVFAYIGGTMLFGWYGLFLGPLLVVLGVQLARIVVPELIHGDPVTREVEAAESLGTTPENAASDDVTTDGGKSDETEADGETNG